MPRSIGVLTAVALASLAWPSVAISATAAPAVAVDPEDLPVEIHATLGEADTYATVLWLSAVGEDIDELAFLASNLEAAGDAKDILRTNVKVDDLATVKLTSDDASDVTLRVDAIKRAGTYMGTIEFFPAGKRSEALRLPLALLVSEQPAFEQGANVSIQVDPEDSPLEIRAFLGQDATFAESIRLSSSGAGITGFSFLPSRLRRDDGEVVIGRQQVELIGTRNIGRGEYVDFQVKATGVTRAGVYRGELKLVRAGRPLGEATVVPVSLVVRASPTLDPVKDSDQLQLRLARCTAGDCGAASLLVPDAAETTRRLVFRVPARSDVEVRRVRAVARGDDGGHDLTTRDLSFTVEPEADGFIVVHVTAHPERLPADKYTGSLFLTLAGRDDPVVVPIDVAVKDGPIGAALVILGALLVGRAFRWATGESGPLGESRESLARLWGRVEREVPGERALLAEALEQLEHAVERKDVEKATALAKTLDARIDLLVRIRRIERSTTDPTTLALLGQARRLVGLGRDDAAAKAVEKAEDGLVRGAPVANALQTALAAEAEAQPLPPWQSQQRRLSKPKLDVLRGVSFALLGTSSWVLGTARSYWTAALRVGFGFLLLVLLTVVGLETLYANASDSFGSSKIYDYLALVVWGLSAEVVQRTLTNLRGDTT